MSEAVFDVSCIEPRPSARRIGLGFFVVNGVTIATQPVRISVVENASILGAGASGVLAVVIDLDEECLLELAKDVLRKRGL